jgi:OmpA-OmpF porin, OOP family
MIKKYMLATVILFITCCQFMTAQVSGITKKPALFGFSANAVDFTPSELGTDGLQFGPSLYFWKGISNKIDFSVRYNALFSNYTKQPTQKTYELANEFEGSLHAKALKDNHLFNPFLTAGIGIGQYGSQWAPYAPLGGGLQVNFLSESYLFVQAHYRVSLATDKLDNNTFYSLGVAGRVGGAKTPPVAKEVSIPAAAVPVVAKDADNDGVVDSLDACPTEAGTSALKGCPDKDSDGISDKEDKCPDVAGIAKYQGCPIPDGDKDGVNDEEDKCPTEAGVARYQGCPIPDGDKDGVNDEDDKCPALVGDPANNGCPVIKEEVRKRLEVAAKNIYFASASDKLLPKSNKSLNQVAAIIKQDANLKLDIEGHTDNKGKEEKNQQLSDKRAAAVLAFLSKKGIQAERLKSAGYGSTKPVADNKTLAGRTKNRRVELKLHYD